MSEDLIKHALSARRRLIQMHFKAKSAHIGSSLSAIDLLVYLYGKTLRPQDRFLLSKGHAASGWYSVLAEFGRMTETEIGTYYQDGTYLGAHPSSGFHPEILAATGSLGHGLPIAVGLTFGSQILKGSRDRTFVMLSDGECNEGTVWEAALFAGHHRLSKLCVIVDCNGIQGFGRTHEVLQLEPFREKWESFGFEVGVLDGHSFTEMDSAFTALDSNQKPLCLIAKTIKGRGVRFMEDTVDWHYLSLNDALFSQAMQDLGGSK